MRPFYPYARQDKKGRGVADASRYRPGSSRTSTRLVADLYKAAGANRIMSLDLHGAQIQGNGAIGIVSPRPTRSSPIRRPRSCRASSSTRVHRREFIDAADVTDTLPIPEETRRDRLTILPIVYLTARAIHEAFDDGSVTSMFDGAA